MWRRSRDCRQNNNSGFDGGSGNGGGSSGAECYRCGKVGHIARSCPDAPGSKNSYNSYGGGGYGGGGYGGAGFTQITLVVATALSLKGEPATPVAESNPSQSESIEKSISSLTVHDEAKGEVDDFDHFGHVYSSDLCIRFKKVFSHEHNLYQPWQLPIHLPSIPRRNPNNKNAPQDQLVGGGIHPLCEFCRECYFGPDELFAHMREKHEECFICKRNGIRDQYFQDYGSLEQHFNNAHYPCKDSQCQSQKFVVFGSMIDLKAHMVEQHGSEMSAKDKKDLRRLDTVFEYESREDFNPRQNRNRQRDREREREREEPESSQTSRRREAFGATLTSETSNPPSAPSFSTPPLLDSSQSDVPLAVSERHAAFIARINILTSNPTNAVPAIKSAIRSYRSNESGPRDLINTIFTVVNKNLDDTASLISSLVELLDDEDKRRALLASWNGFKIEQQQQFPDLVAANIGSGYAGAASGRILNIKHSTASRSSSQSSGQVWERVAQAAASTSVGQGPPVRLKASAKPKVSSSNFPTLSATRDASVRHGNNTTTAWSSGGTARPRTEVLSEASSSSNRTPPQLSSALFPTLPVSAKVQRVAMGGNQSLKNILGENNTLPSSAWSQKRDEGGEVQSSVEPSSVEDGTLSTNKGKRKKGKEKQTLFTIGTFPA
ncbi:hypothetical protein Clacol_006531 [Clathrus columnatus]|uniref:CCHC-type domain-containing protein n=1 Tax=Clathrus columnatus TaxID=1419009 RepID=A0AAV5AHD1_9AGAM|nr:hypothetical protein Clacol_006531 [Clathrus columnatus]